MGALNFLDPSQYYTGIDEKDGKRLYGEYVISLIDDIELKGDIRDVVSYSKKMIKDFFFQSVRCFLLTYTTFSENDTFLSLNKKEVLDW